MNFYSHAAIATLVGTDGELTLGAMLPDLCNLIGAKAPLIHCPKVRRGCELHHATDRVFHEVAEFRMACLTESRLLATMGVPRGTAIAAAHVGIELVLDDALGDDETTKAAYQDALALAEPCGLKRAMEWSSKELAARFETLRQRLWTLTREVPVLDAALLVERISRTLATRPKLAVRAGDRPQLHGWAVELPNHCQTLWPGLIASVLSGLEKAGWETNSRRDIPLRFRRARTSQV